MFETGKIHNEVNEMKRLNTEIFEISEIQWPNSGQVHYQREVQVQVEGHPVFSR